MRAVGRAHRLPTSALGLVCSDSPAKTREEHHASDLLRRSRPHWVGCRDFGLWPAFGWLHFFLLAQKPPRRVRPLHPHVFLQKPNACKHQPSRGNRRLRASHPAHSRHSAAEVPPLCGVCGLACGAGPSERSLGMGCLVVPNQWIRTRNWTRRMCTSRLAAMCTCRRRQSTRWEVLIAML